MGKKSPSCKKIIAVKRKKIEHHIEKLMKLTGATDASVFCFGNNGSPSCSLNLGFSDSFQGVEPPTNGPIATSNRRRRK